ncbi:MAG TPA: hypothetical protein VF884_14510 [Nitrososphaeraceae archaeon]
MISDNIPSIILLLDHEDANMVVSGVLGLKGCNVHKAQTADDCLSLLNQFEEKADVVLIKDAFAIDNNLRLVREIRKISPNVIILVLADFPKEELSTDSNDIDQLVVSPLSPENLADKILMLVARKELKKMKEKMKT